MSNSTGLPLQSAALSPVNTRSRSEGPDWCPEWCTETNHGPTPWMVESILHSRAVAYDVDTGLAVRIIAVQVPGADPETEPATVQVETEVCDWTADDLERVGHMLLDAAGAVRAALGEPESDDDGPTIAQLASVADFYGLKPSEAMQALEGATTAEFLSVRSASLLLDGISENTIREAIAAEELPAARFGTSIRIEREELLTWARSKKAPQ